MSVLLSSALCHLQGSFLLPCFFPSACFLVENGQTTSMLQSKPLTGELCCWEGCVSGSMLLTQLGASVCQ